MIRQGAVGPHENPVQQYIDTVKPEVEVLSACMLHNPATNREGRSDYVRYTMEGVRTWTTEADCNLTHRYIPRRPRALELVFGMPRGYATAATGYDAMWLNREGTFVPVQAHPLMSVDFDKPFDGTPCATSQPGGNRCDGDNGSKSWFSGLLGSTASMRAGYLRGLVQRIDDHQSDFVESMEHENRNFRVHPNATMRECDMIMVRGVRVRAVLLDAVDRVADAARRADWTVVAEMLVVHFQNKQVSYSNLLAAIYVFGGLALAPDALGEDQVSNMLAHLLSIPLVHLSLNTRLERIQAVGLGGATMSSMLASVKPTAAATQAPPPKSAARRRTGAPAVSGRGKSLGLFGWAAVAGVTLGLVQGVTAAVSGTSGSDVVLLKPQSSGVTLSTSIMLVFYNFHSMRSLAFPSL